MTAPTWADLARRVGWLLYHRYRRSAFRKWWRRRVTTGRFRPPAPHAVLPGAVISARPTPIMLSSREENEMLKAAYTQRWVPPGQREPIEPARQRAMDYTTMARLAALAETDEDARQIMQDLRRGGLH